VCVKILSGGALARGKERFGGRGIPLFTTREQGRNSRLFLR
jgi:hypothetical protein